MPFTAPTSLISHRVSDWRGDTDSLTSFFTALLNDCPVWSVILLFSFLSWLFKMRAGSLRFDFVFVCVVRLSGAAGYRAADVGGQSERDDSHQGGDPDSGATVV